MATEEASANSPAEMMVKGTVSGAAPPSLLDCSTLSQTALEIGTVPHDTGDVSGQ